VSIVVNTEQLATYMGRAWELCGVCEAVADDNTTSCHRAHLMTGGPRLQTTETRALSREDSTDRHSVDHTLAVISTSLSPTYIMQCDTSNSLLYRL